MGTDNVDLTFDPVPVVNLGVDTTICKGIPLYLDATNPNATYIWQDGTTNSSMIIFDPGTYVVNVTIGTCSKSDTIVIDQQDQPIVDLGEDTLLCYGQPLLYDAYNYGATYEWQDGSTNVTYEPKSPGNYYVTATNQCGTDADSVEVIFEVCNCLVYIPEAFTPNSDNKNDVFNYKYNCTDFEATFDIYNRFGEHVFSAASPDEAWDGTFKGSKSPSGLYIYILSYKGYDNGHWVDTKKKGYFSLIR
jgi:gliding motility-associated-like protein